MLNLKICTVIGNDIHPDVELPTIIIMGLIVVIKFVLMLICWKFKSPSTQVMAQDHRNDCISNTGAIIFAYIGAHFWIYADPIGAIVISIYIAVSWFLTCKEQIAVLSGKSAPPDLINRVINICCEHDERIEKIDTVLAYHFGTKFCRKSNINLFLINLFSFFRFLAKF